MIKPKIALLTQWYLPGNNAGGPVRSIFSLVEFLKSEFEFYIITTNTDLNSTLPYKNIKQNEWFVENKVNYYYHNTSTLLASDVIKNIQSINPNLIYLNSFWSWKFSLNILKNKKAFNCSILLAPRGMLSLGALKIKSPKKKLFFILSKLLNWHNSIYFQASSQIEEKEIISKYPNSKVYILPNISSFSAIISNKNKTVNELNLFYLSRIAKVKNLHLALTYLKSVSPQYKINYSIYGNIEDQNYWEDCLQLINELPNHVNVKYKGNIPFNKVQTTLMNEDCLLLPTMNENFGHSIVESLLSSCPVIISNNTPWLDLEKENVGFNFNENNATAFVKSIEYYASLPTEKFFEIRKSCNLYISNKLNLEGTINNYKNSFNECIKNRLKYI
ncbi:MAG: glycosyltransferase [Bacteroidetes bacterium]|nr:glycosyltransferase [Bacteroidota bacterium]